MQNLEAQLHTLLEEIAQDAHTHEEQAIIIATAASIINKRFTSRRLAKIDNKTIEANMTDALLESMCASNSWADESHSEDYFDGRGMSPNTLINRVAKSNQNKWGKMEILNIEEIGEDDDKEYSDEEIAEKATMQNAQQTNEVFITPGRGKYFTDSISDAVR
jgi:hypothetical protein